MFHRAIQTFGNSPSGHRALGKEGALGKEPISDFAPVEHLDGARMQPARPRANEALAATPLDGGNVDLSQERERVQST
ncbi:MAG: hypothetical protein ACRECE_08920 [Xanthobacteraceae bacterium]